ncbi:class I mannose-6-phosphate isomerase [Chitinophaga deserti]|uniref:class I mannose-6-phosphate isomerase n=1 Tax=Chitinophaga deserti TaxID=2164099 RepID=UPI0018E567DE|nr:class I mannose-6-phosphate isomerase [Chitinophaga deserti]
MSTSFSSQTQSSQLRATDQFLAPKTKDTLQHTGYDIYPCFSAQGPVFSGFDTLLSRILQYQSYIIIDGYAGVQWEAFISQLKIQLAQQNISASFVDVNTALLPHSGRDALLADSIGNSDPLFGKIFTGSLSDFFSPEKLEALQPAKGTLNIIYGCGAALSGWEGALLYIDLPKNEIQFRSRAGKVCNLGHTTPSGNARLQYKQFYFADWPVLNRHKKDILPRVNLIIDEQRPDEITWCEGSTLRNTLATMSKNMFRARPWFEPGVWGGHWIRENIAELNPNVVNYAWSFELIAPENGVLLEHEGLLLEVSLDTMLMLDNKAVLGKAAQRFGTSFPIRFDFLDTFNGGNLSIQCHPSVPYTQQHFGEPFTQDETYYILDSKPGAEVYLGFQENIDAQEFRNVLEESALHNTPVDIEKYVQVFPSHKHDLFLIPNGTVHSSGKNNLVLEISATPYIFTFKMYDWLRTDLNGKPRTLNIARAFDNLKFSRKGAVVQDTLISVPVVIEQGADWRLLNLPTHPEHFYRIERVELNSRVTLDTRGHCHILSLVEGGRIRVITNGLEQTVHYAETFIIPAAAGQYTLINEGEGEAKVVRSFVKDDCC